MKEIVGERGVWRFDPAEWLGSRGGFGSVYAGWDSSGAPVAVKVVPPLPTLDSELLRRREVEYLEMIRETGSQRLIRLLDVAEDGDDLCIVMERADGPLEVPARHYAAAVEASTEIALALSELHSMGIIHRDLKPGNVLRIGPRLVLADFGIAHNSELGTQSVTFKGSGTPQYMSPELLSGGSASVRSDLYALGVVLYQLLTGSLPFEGSIGEVIQQALHSAPPPLPDDVPASLRLVVSRLLSKSPGDRHADARAVVERLSRVGAGKSQVEQRLASRIAQLDDALAAEQARLDLDRHLAEEFERVRSQARADLDELMIDAAQPLIDTDDRFALMPRWTTQQRTSRDWGGGDSRWEIRHPYGGCLVEMWFWPQGPLNNDGLLAAGEIWPGTKKGGAPLANAVFEDLGDGHQWMLYRFSRNVYCPPEKYRLGPEYGQHGLTAADFKNRRPYMLSGGLHIFDMSKMTLTGEALVQLVAESFER